MWGPFLESPGNLEKHPTSLRDLNYRALKVTTNFQKRAPKNSFRNSVRLMTSDDDTHFLATFFVVDKERQNRFQVNNEKTSKNRENEACNSRFCEGQRLNKEKVSVKSQEHFITWLGHHNWDTVSIELKIGLFLKQFHEKEQKCKVSLQQVSHKYGLYRHCKSSFSMSKKQKN